MQKSCFKNNLKGTHLRLLDLDGMEGEVPGLEEGGSMPILGGEPATVHFNNMPILGKHATMHFERHP